MTFSSFCAGYLDPHWHSRDVRWDDKPPYAMVNIVGECRRAMPTFVSFSKSYAFCGDGPRTILDIEGAEYVTEEFNVDEWEQAMGFLTGTTQLPNHSVSEY